VKQARPTSVNRRSGGLSFLKSARFMTIPDNSR
jgi:hypothetical protein